MPASRFHGSPSALVRPCSCCQARPRRSVIGPDRGLRFLRRAPVSATGEFGGCWLFIVAHNAAHYGICLPLRVLGRAGRRLGRLRGAIGRSAHRARRPALPSGREPRSAGCVAASVPIGLAAGAQPPHPLSVPWGRARARSRWPDESATYCKYANPESRGSACSLLGPQTKPLPILLVCGARRHGKD